MHLDLSLLSPYFSGSLDLQIFKVYTSRDWRCFPFYFEEQFKLSQIGCKVYIFVSIESESTTIIMCLIQL